MIVFFTEAGVQRGWFCQLDRVLHYTQIGGQLHVPLNKNLNFEMKCNF